MPEESDTCRACNVEGEQVTIQNNNNDELESAGSKETVDELDNKEPAKIVNEVQHFWNGDLYVNDRLAIDYINMCINSRHDCNQCSYISVMNEGVAPGRTGGWSMQFCKKFNFKLGDPFKEPPYLIDK